MAQFHFHLKMSLFCLTGETSREQHNGLGVIYLTQSNARLRLKTGPKEPVGDFKCVRSQSSIYFDSTCCEEFVRAISGCFNENSLS